MVQTESKERWRDFKRKDIPDRFEVSEIGRVRNKDTRELLKPVWISGVIGDASAYYVFPAKDETREIVRVFVTDVVRNAFPEVMDKYEATLRVYWTQSWGTPQQRLTEYVTRLQRELDDAKLVASILEVASP